MICKDKNISMRIYYQCSGYYQTNAVFSIWDDQGNLLIDNIAASNQVNARLYYLNFTTPDYDTYLAVKASINGEIQVASQIIMVGEPARKVFYNTSEFDEGWNIPYSIHDPISFAILRTGNFDELGGGFYYVEVEDVPRPWIFKAFPLFETDNEFCF